MRYSTNQATQIPKCKADKSAQCSNMCFSVSCSALGNGTNLVNDPIGLISGMWQTTYMVAWVGGNVVRSILRFCGVLLLNSVHWETTDNCNSSANSHTSFSG